MKEAVVTSPPVVLLDDSVSYETLGIVAYKLYLHSFSIHFLVAAHSVLTKARLAQEYQD